MKTEPSQDMLVNGRYLTRVPTGVDRFAIELLAAMAVQLAPRKLRIAVPPGTELRDASTAETHRVVEAGKHGGQRWEQFDLPAAAGDQPLLNLCNTAPLLRERQLVVIHDLGTVANAANYGVAFKTWYRLMHTQIMRRTRVVATVSRFSADELSRHYGARPRGLEVIYEGGEHILRAASDSRVIDRLGLDGRRYVLAVGSNSPNKNFESVVKAVKLLDDPGIAVVAVGGGDPRVYSGAGVAASNAEAEKAADRALVRTGYVSDGELRALYEQAACFAFPSLYEGFGLPPLEAMCCGCPVVVSDRASLPEVCGDAALYCKAEDPATLARELKRLLASQALQAELREAGYTRSSSFGWDKAARHFQDILETNFA